MSTDNTETKRGPGRPRVERADPLKPDTYQLPESMIAQIAEEADLLHEGNKSALVRSIIRKYFAGKKKS